MNSRATRRNGAPGILDRLGFRQSTVVLLILVAAVAFAASAGRSFLQPQQHDVNTTVFVARVLPGSNSGDVGASIADFVTVIGLPIVRDPVSKETGISTSKLSGVHVNRIETSSAVTSRSRAAMPTSPRGS